MTDLKYVLLSCGSAEDAAGFNAVFTRRVRISGTTDIDAELTGRLRRACGNAGWPGPALAGPVVVGRMVRRPSAAVLMTGNMSACRCHYGLH